MTIYRTKTLSPKTFGHRYQYFSFNGKFCKKKKKKNHFCQELMMFLTQEPPLYIFVTNVESILSTWQEFMYPSILILAKFSVSLGEISKATWISI